jgi:hypothetical protein
MTKGNNMDLRRHENFQFSLKRLFFKQNITTVNITVFESLSNVGVSSAEVIQRRFRWL